MEVDGVRVLSALLAAGSAIWFGGLVTVALLSNSSEKTVPAADRVALFRAFGPRFAVFAGIAALLFLLPALVLVIVLPAPSTATALALSAALVLITAVGIVQARRMSALRAAAASADDDPAGLSRNASLALVLRGLIGALSLVLLVLALLIAARG